MGRAERRKHERQQRINSRKDKVLLSKEYIAKMKKEITAKALDHNAEALMTCFALAEHRLYGFGGKRIMRSLNYIDDLMGNILQDICSIDDYKRELENETGVAIKCD